MPTAKTELLQLCDATQESLTAAQSTLATLRTGIETLPDDDILPDPPQAGPHDYFSELLAFPQCREWWSLRNSQDAIDAMTHGTVPANADNPCFTSQADMAVITLFENISGVAAVGIGSCQLRPSFVPISTGRSIFVWDMRYSPDWSAVRGEVGTHKMFQLAYGDDKRHIEVRCRYSGTGPTDDVGTVEVTSYDSGIAQGSGDQLLPIPPTFSIKPGVWTRYIAVVDYTAKTFSLFVLDETRDAVTIYDGISAPLLKPVNAFWAEINASKDRIGPTVHLGDVRNVVVLHDEDGSLNLDSLKIKPVSE